MLKFFQRLQYDRRLNTARKTKLRLDATKEARASISADHWPIDAEYLNSEIDRLQRQLDGLLADLPKERP